MEYFCDTSMTSSPYPSQLSITSSELNDAATVNGVDALSVKGTQPGGDDLPQVNGHTDSNTIGNTCPTSTDLSWQDAGRASLSVTNVTTAGASYNSTIQKEPDAASIHSSNMANNGSNADSRSIASAAANASLHSDRAKLIAHLTSYAGEHVGDCGRGFCVVHDDGRPLPSTEPYIVNHPLATTPAASKKPDEQSATLSKQAHELQPNSANSTTGNLVVRLSETLLVLMSSQTSRMPISSLLLGRLSFRFRTPPRSTPRPTPYLPLPDHASVSLSHASLYSSSSLSSIFSWLALSSGKSLYTAATN